MIATNYKLLLLNGQEAPAFDVERTGENGELRFATPVSLRPPFEGWLERSSDGKFFRILVESRSWDDAEGSRMFARLLDGENDL